jgi:hypothetical protein
MRPCRARRFLVHKAATPRENEGRARKEPEPRRPHRTTSPKATSGSAHGDATTCEDFSLLERLRTDDVESGERRKGKGEGHKIRCDLVDFSRGPFPVPLSAVIPSPFGVYL